MERLGATAANVLIAVGLAIEYFVILTAIVASGEANRESDEKVAEANERAAEANQKAETERLDRLTLESELSTYNNGGPPIRRVKASCKGSIG